MELLAGISQPVERPQQAGQVVFRVAYGDDGRDRWGVPGGGSPHRQRRGHDQNEASQGEHRQRDKDHPPQHLGRL
jgi:hypothetical protein